jgi:hypothetical protein
MNWHTLSIIVIGLVLGCSKNAREPQSDSESVHDARATPDRLVSNVAAEPVSEMRAERLRETFLFPHSKPSPSLIQELKAEDRMPLMARYLQESELTNKLALTIALGFVGNEETVTELKNTLLRFSKFDPLNAQEESVLLFTVEALGFLAREHDSAFRFLNEATSPWFWKQNTTWRSEGRSNDAQVFAGRALASLAYSERPEVEQVIERLKEQPMFDDFQGGYWLLDSALVDAAFFREFLQNRGLDGLKAIYGTEEILNEFTTWARTENGKGWRQWSKQWREIDARSFSPN